MNYKSKWVGEIYTSTNDAKIVTKYLQKNIFTRVGTPRAIISDRGSHFCNYSYTLLSSYNVKLKVSTPYLPQTSGQIEVSNRKIKGIWEKVVST